MTGMYYGRLQKMQYVNVWFYHNPATPASPTAAAANTATTTINTNNYNSNDSNNDSDNMYHNARLYTLRHPCSISPMPEGLRPKARSVETFQGKELVHENSNIDRQRWFN